MEAVRKAGLFSKHYALSIVVTLVPPDTIQSDFRLVKETILNWIRARGKKAKELMFVIVADEAQHPEIDQFVRFIATEEVVLSELFKQMSAVRVTLLAMDGQPRSEFTL